MRRRSGSLQVGLLNCLACLAVLGCEGVLGPSFEPTSSLVAVRLPDSELARVGLVELESGAPIHLHAVLVGQEDGRTVYATSANQLEIDGSLVPAEHMRPWPDQPVRCLWQTLQPAAPFLEIGSAQQLGKLSFSNYSHPDWGIECTALATITARQRETLTVPDDAKRLAFGTQIYQVWVELLNRETDLVAAQSLRSPVPEVSSDAELGRVGRVSMRLQGALEAPASVFGKTQLGLAEDAAPSLGEQLDRLHQSGLFFVDRLLFRKLTGNNAQPVTWSLVEINGSLPFVPARSEPATKAAQPGDLLRVGARFVVLFRDVGETGVVDPLDLVFDFERGAIVRPIADVFTGDGDGDVEWARRSTATGS